MGTFTKIVALLRCIYPLPTFTDAASVLKWLNGLSPAGSELIAFLAGQLQTKGSVEILLPDGDEVSIRKNGTEYSYGFAASAIPYEGDMEADGKWLALFKQLLPLIIQYLPSILKKDTDVVVPIK